jgi:hypothetical protein
MRSSTYKLGGEVKTTAVSQTVLCSCIVFVEGLCSAVLYPVIPFIVASLLSPPPSDSAVAVYSGLLTACHGLGQVVALGLW